MALKEEVALFLKGFHQKMTIWEIRFRDDRRKNAQALFDLEISPAQRIQVIEHLCVANYSEGPKEDSLNAGSPLWVFGKKIKQKMVYIKITMGDVGRPVICISFHEAEYEMNFPLTADNL